MPVSVEVEFPSDNEVYIDPHFLEIGSGFVSVKGRGNVIRIERPGNAHNAHFVVENGASIRVGPGCWLGSVYVYALAKGSSIEIGEGTGFSGVAHITAHEPAAIRIGSNCLFGGECSITSSDVHHILDRETMERLNPAGDITIGDRVWFGGRAVALSNTEIGSDSVVGWASVVKGRFPSNVVIAGSPGRITRTGIVWKP